jgi:hypothetical protein
MSAANIRNIVSPHVVRLMLHLFHHFGAHLSSSVLAQVATE